MSLTEQQKKLYNLLEKTVDIFEKEHIWYSMAYGSVLGIVREKGFIPWDTDIDIFVSVDDIEKVREAIRKYCSEFKLQLISKDEDTTSTHDKITFVGENHSKCHIDVYPLIGVPSSNPQKKRFVKRCYVLNKIFSCKYEDVTTVRKKSKKVLFVLLQSFEKLIPDAWFRNAIKRIETKYPIAEAEYICIFANDGKESEAMKREVYLETEKYPFYELYVPIPKNYDSYLKNLYGDDYMIPKQY